MKQSNQTPNGTKEGATESAKAGKQAPVSTLAGAALNEPHRILDLKGDSVIVSRLREIGFVRGEEVQVRGRALFGEPILVEIRGAIVALRKTEATCVRL